MRRIFLLLAICSLSGCGALSGEGALYDKVLDAYNKGDYATAIKYCDQIIAMDPSCGNAYIARGDSYTLSGNPDKGIEDETKALTLDLENDSRVQAYIDRSSAYADKQLWDNEIADCQAAIKLNSNCEAAYSNLVGAYALKGDLDKGLESAKAALALDPNDPITLKFQAIIFRKKRDYASAKVTLLQVANLVPTQSKDINATAWFLATCPDPAARDGKKAVELATKVCQQTNWAEPNDIDTLAAAYAETGDFASAIKYEKQVLAGTLKDDARKDAQAHLIQFQANQPFHEKS